MPTPPLLGWSAALSRAGSQSSGLKQSLLPKCYKLEGPRMQEASRPPHLLRTQLTETLNLQRRRTQRSCPLTAPGRTAELPPPPPRPQPARSAPPARPASSHRHTAAISWAPRPAQPAGGPRRSTGSAHRLRRSCPGGSEGGGRGGAAPGAASPAARQHHFPAPRGLPSPARVLRDGGGGTDEGRALIASALSCSRARLGLFVNITHKPTGAERSVLRAGCCSGLLVWEQSTRCAVRPSSPFKALPAPVLC